MISRRNLLQAGAIAPLVSTVHGADEAWTREWDRVLLDVALRQQDAAFDPRESMLQSNVGPEYNYHSLIRSQTAHPTRQSFTYALLLLEAGGAERDARASRVLHRALALQDTDPSSKWYGIWSYYLEEPPPKMSPADWNWADFNGATLLLIANRHGERLAPALRQRVSEGILHAARSVQRRNVSMSYTNIAIQGTFVTLAAAQLLDDADLRRYAVDRLHRFAATVDVTGSFDEYNSPAYAAVSIVNLTRMRMTLRDPEILALAGRIHTRAWLHIARHWHVATRQLAGPMSRCYQTDIGAPLWIQKALGGKPAFSTLDEIKAQPPGGGADVAVHDFLCPAVAAELFRAAPAPHQHRELFIGAPAGVTPVAGTTWLDRDFCLGTVNRGDFWVQRRPLLAYWGGPRRPARFVQMRFMKDDYDFSSALLYSVQEKNYALGLANFRSPGGDKHISLDPIPDGEFQASRFRLCVNITGAPEKGTVLADESRIAVDLGGAKLWFAVRNAVFGEWKPQLSTARETGRLVISLDLIPHGESRTIRWREMPAAYVVFAVAMEGNACTLTRFDRRCQACRFEGAPESGFQWATPAGLLSLRGAAGVRPIAEMDRAFAAAIDGAPVPLIRLSEEKLA